jgi:hypothetical protein
MANSEQQVVNDLPCEQVVPVFVVSLPPIAAAAQPVTS